MHRIKRTVLVTGASSGIGQAISHQLLDNNYCVIGVSRDKSRLPEASSLFTPVTLDLSQLDEIPAWSKQIQRDFPELDAVVFAAGFGHFASLEEFSYAQIQQLMTVNFTAQVFLTRALLPALKQKSHANLIYIGSEAALQGSRKGSIYCASKFALRGFTQALRDECGKSSVRVSLINPGMVQTPFFDKLSFMPGTKDKQALQAEDVADLVNYILNAGDNVAIEEITVNPVNKVILFKK